MADGRYTFAVQATDSSGLTDPTPATRTFTVDTTPPAAPTLTGTSGATNNTTAAFTYTDTDTDIASWQCALTPAPPGQTTAFGACPTSGISYANLPEGAYTFQARAIDSAGNTGSPTSRTFTVDTTAPQVSMTGPSGPTDTTSPTFTWTSDPDVDHYECTFQSSSDTSTPTPTTCSSPTTQTGLSEGDYTFTVRAVDTAGNIGTTTTRAITIDTTAPHSTITGGSTGPVIGSSASFTYASDDTAPGTTFECQLIGPGSQSSDFAPCDAAGTSYDSLADGDYTFQVRSLDAAGNIGPIQDRTFRVNVGRPTITTTVTSAVPMSATGWYRTPVTITYTCDGAGSPLAIPCPAAHITKRRGLDRDIIGTVRTVDGDSAQVSTHLKIDRFAPRVYPTHFKKFRTYTHRPRVGCQGIDGRSGIASCKARTRISRDSRLIIVHLKAIDHAGNITRRTLKAPYAGS